MTGFAILVDTGVLVALYDSADRYHDQVLEFLGNYRGRLITTLGCVTEVMWLLASDYRVQNEFLRHLSDQIYECESLQSGDFVRIAELNTQYSDLPADECRLGAGGNLRTFEDCRDSDVGSGFQCLSSLPKPTI